MKNQNEIRTEERRRRQKKNVRHQINTTIKQTKNSKREKERTEITNNIYLHTNEESE